jgi:hypothetical protein
LSTRTISSAPNSIGAGSAGTRGLRGEAGVSGCRTQAASRVESGEVVDERTLCVVHRRQLHARTEPNLTRLATALRALDARLRVAGEAAGVEHAVDARTFRLTQTVTSRTRAGDLDVALLPDGTDGYPDLIRGRVLMTIDDVTFPVAVLSDVIRSKAAAGRPKDLAVLDLLRELDRRRRSD